MNSSSGNSCQCQFCQVNKMCGEITWPVACRPLITEIQATTTRGHTLLAQIRSTQGRNANINTQDTLNIISSLLNSLDKCNSQRLQWWWKDDNRQKRIYWKSESEKEARREKHERGDAKDEGKFRKQLQQMQSINTKARNMIVAIDTRIGFFCRHVLGGVDPDQLRSGEGVKIEGEDEDD